MFLKSLGAALAALTLAAACGPQYRASVAPIEGDATLGALTGYKVTVIEYGAPTCPGCKHWHETVWGQLKKMYVDTNKIRFIFREFPSHNPPVDKAIFAIARCAGKDDWFRVIDEAFKRQMDIEIASRQGKAMEAMNSLGAQFQLSPEQVQGCVDNRDIIRRVIDSQAEGVSRGVDSTPTIFVNDRMVPNPTFNEMSRLIEAELAGNAPAAPPAETPGTPPAPHDHQPGDQH